MKSFVIGSEDDGIRLNRYLEKCVPQLSGTMMYRALRLKRIKCNGKRCEASQRLSAGDVLTLYLNDEVFSTGRKLPSFLKAGRHLTVLYEDENLAVLSKPAGIIVHGDKKEFDDTLVNRFLRYLYEKGEYTPKGDGAFIPALVNRLDRNTEGLVLGAKNAAALSGLTAMIRERRVEKTYRCVTVSRPPKDGVYTAFLVKDAASNQVRVFAQNREGAKEIITAFRTLREKNGLFLCEATLITGRTHQIRAHLRSLGAPILGDEKYGDPEKNKRYGEKGQLLCAAKLVFHPDQEKDPLLWYLDGVTVEQQDIPFVAKYF